jgi:hypothetical protein
MFIMNKLYVIINTFSTFTWKQSSYKVINNCILVNGGTTN